jgi:hypothetical protein
MARQTPQEIYSRGYVSAVAGAAGCAVAVPYPETDSVDLILKHEHEPGPYRFPMLEVQVKSISTLELEEDDESFSYDLKKKNYDDLRGIYHHAPRLLFVVLVPRNSSDWTFHSEEELLLRRCGYWVSLRNAPESNNTATVAVTCHRKDSLSPASLRDIMIRIASGDIP